MVDAEFCDKLFFAVELEDGKVVSCEHNPDNYPERTVVVYENLEDFVSTTTWLDYIVEGIQDDRIHELLKKIEEGTDEQNDVE